MMLHNYFHFLAQVASRAGLITVLVLVLALVLFLSGEARRPLRLTLALLLLHVVFLGSAALMSSHSQVHGVLSSFARFFLLCALGRATFLLITQVIFRGFFARIPKLYLDVTHGLLYLTALMVTLSLSGISPGSLMTSSVLLSATIAFALRDTVGNVFAGLTLRAQNAFVVGDWIQEGRRPGVNGKVREINWRAVSYVALDKVEITVPHSRVSQGDLVVITRPEHLVRRSIHFHAPYDAPPQQIRETVLNALPGTWGILEDPPPSLVTEGFDERGVAYWLRYFISEIDRRNGIDNAVRERVWYALNRAGIQIPVPTRDVVLERARDVDQHHE